MQNIYSLTVELSIRASSEAFPKLSGNDNVSFDPVESYKLHLEAGSFPWREEARQSMAKILDSVLPTLKRPTVHGDDTEHLNLAEYEVCLALTLRLS